MSIVTGMKELTGLWMHMFEDLKSLVSGVRNESPKRSLIP